MFEAYDGQAARELCEHLPEIALLVLNTEGTGMRTPDLIRGVREVHPGLPVLHIGRHPIVEMPDDVLNLPDTFDSGQLLGVVRTLIARGSG